MKRQTVDKIFALIFGIVGFILFAISWNGFDNLPVACTNPLIYNGLLVVLTVGTILMTVAIMYYMCIRDDSNKCELSGDDDVTEIYLYFTSGLSGFLVLLLMSMGLQIGKEPSCMPAPPSPQANMGRQLRFNIWFMFGLSMMSLMGSASALYYINYVSPSLMIIDRTERKKTQKQKNKIALAEAAKLASVANATPELGIESSEDAQENQANITRLQEYSAQLARQRKQAEADEKRQASYDKTMAPLRAQQEKLEEKKLDLEGRLTALANLEGQGADVANELSVTRQALNETSLNLERLSRTLTKKADFTLGLGVSGINQSGRAPAGTPAPPANTPAPPPAQSSLPPAPANTPITPANRGVSFAPPPSTVAPVSRSNLGAPGAGGSLPLHSDSDDEKSPVPLNE